MAENRHRRNQFELALGSPFPNEAVRALLQGMSYRGIEQGFSGKTVCIKGRLTPQRARPNRAGTSPVMQIGLEDKQVCILGAKDALRCPMESGWSAKKD